MQDSIIHLENISLVDFFGVNNVNFNEISSAFPHAKIISRGNEIKIAGSQREVKEIRDIIESLLVHYKRFGHLEAEEVHSYILGKQVENDKPNQEAILHSAKGAAIKPKTKNQQKMADLVAKNDIVFAVGPAGTGKTYMAVALALQALKNKEVKKIIVTRPAVEAGENLGFLPGDLNEKIYPYLRPVFDAFEELLSIERLKFYQENNIIEIAPLAYMRGRTLSNAFIVLDEAQNSTSVQLKMVLTRLGQGSKAIITGDLTQIDLPKRQTSGLAEAVRLLDKISGIGFIEMKAADVCRHPLVAKIIKAYESEEGGQ